MSEASHQATVMVVDDTPANLTMLEEILRGAGYRVVTAAGGRQALEQAPRLAPDLILLDLLMPEMDGIELCRLLKAAPALRAVPVMFISGLDDVASKLCAFEEGAVDYVSRPFAAEELLARVRTQLALRAARRALERQQHDLEAAVGQRTEQLLNAQRIARIGAWAIDLERDRIEWIGDTHRMFGLPDRSPVSFTESIRRVHPQDRPRVEQAWRDALAGESPEYAVTYRVVADGKVSWIDERAELQRDATGRPLRALGTVQDVSERKAYEAALRQQQERLEVALEAANAGAWEWDITDDRIRASERWARMLGYAAGEVGELTKGRWEALAHPDDQHAVRRALQQYLAGAAPAFEVEHRLRNGRGEWTWVRSVGRTVKRDAQGQASTIAGIDVDISQQKEQEAQLAYVASHDELTGLPNRMAFAHRLAEAMQQSHRTGQPLAVAYMDLDGLAEFNERHGQPCGDRLIAELASRLVACCGAGEVARVGGDEFTCILQARAPGEDLEDQLEQLMRDIASPVVIDGEVFSATASIGAAVLPPQGGIDAEQLLRQADQAMYQSKLSGKNRYTFFDAERDEITREYRAQVEDIRRGLDANEFELHYQPKVNMRFGTVLGFEALVRWRHPGRGLLRPAEFIPLLEEHPLAIALGERGIALALEQLAAWNDSGLETSVSINVTSLQLHDPDFLGRLQRRLEAHPSVRRNQLEIEVVETGAMRDIAHVSALMERLRDLGVGAALDDFGTGFSSLTFLKRLAAGTIKIDQSFVCDLLDDQEHAVIVDSICRLAESFSRKVIAEGVETEVHGRLLLELGCELGQGYAIARPMPAAEVPEWMRGWTPPASWRESTMLPRERVPELFAELGHRAWRNALRSYLEGRRKSLPELDPRACRLGEWLSNARVVSMLGHREEFRRARELHEQCHAGAERAATCARVGRMEDSQAALDKTIDTSNQVLDLLKALRKRP
ncbi:EAL domain-containing protein [Thioalkalivibrio sp. XN279]|uniref:EAL domain-containing protein n=1 Tax=Thioalkalivibrio sp. XN279 TaxID=2714953 RepID=UPI001409247E|nr:EAL domain-containing protein [Thioalkalivibrio sp. XN279]NHA14713.1 EAL domain-containing protein [Thioalkalivibrio sp. XN279]